MPSQMERRERESQEKKTRALKTPTVHSLAISLRVCACSCQCDSQLFYANSQAEEDYSPKTCLELIIPRQATRSALFRDRPQQDSVFF